MALSNGFDDHHDDEDEYFGIGQKYIYIDIMKMMMMKMKNEEWNDFLLLLFVVCKKTSCDHYYFYWLKNNICWIYMMIMVATNTMITFEWIEMKCRKK